jgi:hypothetical protein
LSDNAEDKGQAEHEHSFLFSNLPNTCNKKESLTKTNSASNWVVSYPVVTDTLRATAALIGRDTQNLEAIIEEMVISIGTLAAFDLVR